jgi:hypothetical protein
MPPIGQQGSRGGLITAMVIFAILFLTSAIFAIYFNANMRQAELKILDIQKKYDTVVGSDQLGSESALNSAVAAIREKDQTLADRSIRAVDVAMIRGDRYGKMITGGDAPGLTAIDTATSRINSSNVALAKGGAEGIKLNPDNLLVSIEQLVAAILDRERNLASLSDKTQKQLKESTATVEASKEAVAKAEDATKTAQAETAKVREDWNKDRTEKQGQIDTINAQVVKDREDFAKQLEAINLQVTAANGKISEQDKLIEKLKHQINKRMDTKEATVRRIDAYITRVSDDGKSVYINRGSGDQLSPGMTFEVYDKNEGVPPLGDGMREEDMPVGKGSVEVISVGATSSECRIVKTTPGMQMGVGDPIANLVYDPNVKFNFVIYGKFDLDRNKVSTDQEGDVIKRLVTQWGGRITDKIDVDTDFVVLGTEPVLPNFGPDDMELAENVKRMADAQAELEAYSKVRADAKDLHIPVMNQNRFLYFVGYYDQAKR